MNLKLTKLELVRPNFVFHFDKIRIKNPILVFHFSIENEFVICLPCALKIKWSPQKQPGEGGRSLFINTGNTCDMAVLADVGVDFVHDLLSGRSKTVKSWMNWSREQCLRLCIQLINSHPT